MNPVSPSVDAPVALDHHLDADWRNAIGQTPRHVVALVEAVVAEHRCALATEFYAVLMATPDATHFLSHEAVQTRLHPAIQRWLTSLFAASQSLDDVVALQRQVGEVHARAEIPVELMARGMRLLKSRLFGLLAPSSLSRADLVHAVAYTSDLMDLALAEMNTVYVHSHEKGARTDEVFRMVSAGQNAAMERHRQLAALAEWENSVLRTLTTGGALQALASLHSSSFGLWAMHKAPLMFDDAEELSGIYQHVERIDRTLLPLIAGPLPPGAADGASSGRQSALRDFLADLEEIRYLINVLFDRLTELEAGRDVLTQLYNRRFLATIMRREMSLARRQNSSFAMLMIDVDHFKRVNDEHGHEAGDRTLQHVAALLMSHGRVSDFYFRYGGEEFLAVINEVNESEARAVAEKIRLRIEQADIQLSESVNLKVTVSLGVAMYNGHPDYRHLINRADVALYEAKHAGRNRVCVAQDTADSGR